MSVKHRFFVVLLALGLLLPAGMHTPALAEGGTEPAVSPTAEGLALEWHSPDLQVIALPEGKSHLVMSGYQQVDQPGAPRLPYSAVLVTLPVGATPMLELRKTEQREINLKYPVELAEQPQGVQLSPDGKVIGGAFAPSVQPVPFDPATVVLEPLGSLRGVQLARLVFYPVRIEGDQLRWTTHVQVVLHYKHIEGNALKAKTDLDPTLDVLRSSVVNPQDLQVDPGNTPAPALQVAEQATNEPRLAVEVNQSGLTAITYEALAAAGFPTSGAKPEEYHLNRAGVEIPLEREADRLLFYAEPRFSRWTSSDVYFLTLSSGSPALSMADQPAAPGSLPAGSATAEVPAEQNKIYTPDCYCAPIPAGRDGDRWVWDRLQWSASTDGSSAPVSASYPIDLAGVDTTQPAQLNLWLIGFTDINGITPDHRVDVSLNGASLSRVEWGSAEPNTKTATQAPLNIPPSTLVNGTNTLTLTLTGGLPGVSLDGVWLDAFSIQYSLGSAASADRVIFSGNRSARKYSVSLNSASGLRAYDITDPDQPTRLSGIDINENTLILGDPAAGNQRYLVTDESGIASPVSLRMVAPLQSAGVTGADFVIITPDQFDPALTDLKALHEKQGLKVATEFVQSIYDTYGDGRPDPTAIKAFLAHTYTDWNPRPSDVLLVGDGTSDPKQYLPDSAKTFIPPYLAVVDPWAGETAADNRYVTLIGDDNLPEMLIGRLPVNSLEETQIVVNKIVGYADNPVDDQWNRDSLFVADDSKNDEDFPGLSDRIAAAVPPSEDVRRLYSTPPDTSANDYLNAFHWQLLGEWNQGASLVVYTGHSSIQQWAAEDFIHVNDIGFLNNGGKLPVLLEMTCFTSSFQVPGFNTLDETILRHPGGGAVAAWGPTGLGVSTGHELLAQGFLSAVFSASAVFQEKTASLGEAALAGKLKLVAEGSNATDLIDTFTLLGDPAVPLDLTSRPDLIFLPQANR